MRVGEKISIHSLTRRLTTEEVIALPDQTISIHSLTRRLTESFPAPAQPTGYFNSQPHKEADAEYEQLADYLIISIHSLTRRLTLSRKVGAENEEDFNSQPHKEADEDSHTSRPAFGHFNSQPHKEADRFVLKEPLSDEISIHSLTRRLTN